MIAYSNVHHFVVSNAFTFGVPCCDVSYHFCIKIMYVSSLHPDVCRRARVLFILFLFILLKTIIFFMDTIGGVVCSPRVG